MIAIKFENISKQYQLGTIGTGTLSHDLNRWWQMNIRGKEDPYLKVGQSNTLASKEKEGFVWALRDINLRVEQGEVLGIIGKNGAGKSTLLKLLSRVTAPTTGRIRAWGRVASLLEVGTGFHPEMTGRENIYMNGSIMGMTKVEIHRKFDEIVDFAGVERYIDTPVKRYSSGMTVRLGFAIAAYLEPEILVVDEVLAVGDAEFQKKAIGKMQDISQGEGRTVLFVSHNMGAVQNLCKTGIVMENGIISFIGSSADAVNLYEIGSKLSTSWVGEDGDYFVKIRETRIQVSGENGLISNSSEINVKMVLELMQDFNDLVIGFTLKSIYGNCLASVLYNDYNDNSVLKKGWYEVVFSIPPFTLATGEYIIKFNVSIPYVKLINSEKVNLSFKIISESGYGDRFFLQGNREFNSVIRPGWFKSIEKVS
jgi:lipopolysaccharide transport system ATP-binding protein